MTNLKVARSLIEADKFEEALTILRSIEQGSRGLAEFHYLYGMAIGQCGDAAAGIDQLNLAQQYGADAFWCQWNRAALHLANGAPDMALSDALQGLVTNPGSEGLRSFLLTPILPALRPPVWADNILTTILDSSTKTSHISKELSRRTNHLASLDYLHWRNQRGYEGAVQNAVWDLVRPGDGVFDVGANFGGITVALSRCAGPRGQVFAFEASPRNMERLNATIVSNALNNVFVIHQAVFSRDDQVVPIYMKHGGYADSLFINAGETFQGEKALVPTCTLDSVCKKYDMWPRFIKMDIEFAEYEALVGARTLIDRYHPIIVLEVWKDNPQSISLLIEYGYVGLSLETFERFDTIDEFLNSTVANVLMFHRSDERVQGVYRSSRRVTGPTIAQQTIYEGFSGSKSEFSIDLPAGKHILDLVFEEGGRDGLYYVTVFGILDVLADYCTKGEHFERIPICISLSRPEAVRFEIRHMDGRAEGLRAVSVRSILPA